MPVPMNMVRIDYPKTWLCPQPTLLLMYNGPAARGCTSSIRDRIDSLDLAGEGVPL